MNILELLLHVAVARRALQTARGRSVKGERAQRRREYVMAVAALAAATPARGA